MLDRDPAAAVNKMPAPEPGGTSASSGQARVLSALQADVANGHHLMCVSGPAGSGKTPVLVALRQNLTQGLTIMVPEPVAGALLRNILTALKLGNTDASPVAARRRLAIRLAMAEQHDGPIVIIVDQVHQLLAADMDLLLHFFPPGHASIVIAGTGEPHAWFAGSSAQDDALSSMRIYSLEPPADAEVRAATPSVRNLATSSTRSLHSTPEAAPPQSPVPPLPSIATQDVPRAAPAIVAFESPLARQQRALEAALSAASMAVNALTAAQAQLQDRWRLMRSVRRWRTATFVISLLLIAVLAIDLLHLGKSGDTAMAPSAASGQAPPVLATQVPTTAGSYTDERASSENNSHDSMTSAAPRVERDSASPAHDPSATAAQSVRVTAMDASAERAGTLAGSDPHVDESSNEVEAPPEQSPPRTESRGSDSPAPDGADADHPAVAAVPAPQRDSAGRIYADRAEYEWRKGRLGDAMRSVERGLASDPGNPRLLELQSVLRGESEPR